MLLNLIKKIEKKINEYNIRKKKLSEIKKIKQSDNLKKLDEILNSSLRNDFINFCSKNKIQENLSFYLEMDLYHKNKDNKFKKRLSTHIYDKYIREDSQLQINICNETKTKIENNDNFSEKYNDALLHIKSLLLERSNSFLNDTENNLKKSKMTKKNSSNSMKNLNVQTPRSAR